MDHKPTHQPNAMLQVTPQHRSQSGRSAVSGQTSISQSKSRASTRQSGLTNISNWTASSAFSTTLSVKSSFYPSSGFPATNALSGSKYPNSGYPMPGLPDTGLPGLNYGYPAATNYHGYPAHNYPGFPNFPCCEIPGAIGLQPFYPGSEFPSSAFPDEIAQEDESQPFIGMYGSELTAKPVDTGEYNADSYGGGGYPSGGFPYMSNMDVTNGYYAYSSQQNYPH